MENNKKQEDRTTEKVSKGSNKGFLNVVINITAQYFYILVILVVIVILASGYFFLLKPKFDVLMSQKREAEKVAPEISAQLTQYDGRIEELQKIIDGYSQLKEDDKEKINKILPSEQEAKELFVQINKIVKSNGLLLSSIKLTESQEEKKSPRIRGVVAEEGAEKEKLVDKSKASEVEIEIEVNGASYLAFKSLLNSLENNLRLIDVQSVGYNPEDESVNLALKAYYLGK